MRRAPARPVFACFVRTCFTVVVREHDLRATTVHLISNHLISLISCHLISARLISSYPFSHVTEVSSSQLFSSHPSTETSSSQLISAVLHARKLLPLEQNLLHKKHEAHRASAHRSLKHRCIYTENLDNILCNTKPAQSTSQYYFVPQSMHKVRPSTTLYYKACAKHFSALLCTTMLAQSTS